MNCIAYIWRSSWVYRSWDCKLNDDRVCILIYLVNLMYFSSFCYHFNDLFTLTVHAATSWTLPSFFFLGETHLEVLIVELSNHYFLFYFLKRSHCNLLSYHTLMISATTDWLATSSFTSCPWCKRPVPRPALPLFWFRVAGGVGHHHHLLLRGGPGFHLEKDYNAFIILCV